MTLENFKKNYPEIEDFLDKLIGHNTFQTSIDDNHIDINIPFINKTIRLEENDLVTLESNEKITYKKDLEYIGSCGYRYKNFYEISLNISHPGYTFFDESNDWRASPLSFKIDENQFLVGPSSPLFVLLTEPVYSDRDFHYGFEKFATITLVLNNRNDYKSEIIKALYYLNAFYLKNIGFVASINHLRFEVGDPLGIFYEHDIDEVFKKVSRTRNRKRKDFYKTEPLCLYNHANTLNSDQKFLYLYRVLEFFTERAKERKLKELRFDNTINETEILKTLDLKNEEKHLEMLLKESVTESLKRKLTGYAFNNRLIEEEKFNKLVRQLYKFRNSVVHAKEGQIQDTLIPNPFEENLTINRWIYIADELSRRCIKKYNEK